MSERDEFTIETPQGERITYVEGKEGYWSATQEGMPDVWGLSRVASRAVSALRSAQRALDAANQNVKILREQYERVNPSETRGELRAVPSRETSE